MSDEHDPTGGHGVQDEEGDPVDFTADDEANNEDDEESEEPTFSEPEGD